MMHKTRRITAVVIAACTVALITVVCHQWHLQGCGPESILCAIAVYGGVGVALWTMVDSALKHGDN